MSEFDCLTDAPDSVWQCQKCRYVMADIAWQSYRVRRCPRCGEDLSSFFRFKNIVEVGKHDRRIESDETKGDGKREHDINDVGHVLYRSEF